MASSLMGSKGFGSNRTGQDQNNMTGYGQLGGNKIPKGYQMGQLQQFSPDQMDLFKQLFSQVGSDSSLGKLSGGDQSQFDQMEAPALRQLGQLQGGLASRFSGMGMGARNSSGHQQAQNSLISDFSEKLQGNRMNLQRQAQQDLFGLSHDLLGQRPYDQFLSPEQKPWWQEALIGAGSGFGQGLGALLAKLLGIKSGG